MILLDGDILSLFVVDAVPNGEATGTVYYFDSDEHRNAFIESKPLESGLRYVPGISEASDWIDGTVCDYCGEEL